MDSEPGRTGHTVGEVFRRWGAEYSRGHPMTDEQRRALRMLSMCRTSALGGHLESCDRCGFERPVYNSCRDDMTGHRRSYRLQGREYSGCGYYVTICTRDRACLFGEVRSGEMCLTDMVGSRVGEWYRSADLRGELTMDAFVVMPNHVHGIVFINGQKGDPPVAPTLVNGPRPRSLGSFIAGYKSSVTRRIAWAQSGVGATGGSPCVGAGRTVWQRNYHDHIVRNGTGLAMIRRYILDNPREWETDDHYVS